MSPAGQQLLLLSRDTLLAALDTPSGERIVRLLSGLTRKGCHVLLTAPEPDHWFPTRGSVDHALDDQRRLQQRIDEAGGSFDGVYYVPRSLFTQDRNREGALQDILARYAARIENTLLVSASVPFLRVAQRLALDTREIPEGASGAELLETVLEELGEKVTVT